MATIQEFDYSVNLLKSILWQYDQTENIKGLITKKQEWYDVYQSQFWSDWFNDVFNLQTANLFGLSVWSLILGVPLYVPYDPEPEEKPIWGFNDNSDFPILQNTYVNFDNGNFSARGDVIILTEEEQRFLLRLRYYQLVCRGEVWSTNIFLDYLVNSSDIGFTGAFYALDGANMTIKYIITEDDFPAPLLDVLIKLDILPRPAGVFLDGVLVDNGAMWGFNDNSDFPILQNTYVNFDNGNFYDGIFNTF